MHIYIDVICSLYCLFCAVFSFCYVKSLVCVLCSLQLVLCAVFSLSYV